MRLTVDIHSRPPVVRQNVRVPSSVLDTAVHISQLPALNADQVHFSMARFAGQQSVNSARTQKYVDLLQGRILANEDLLTIQDAQPETMANGKYESLTIAEGTMPSVFPPYDNFEGAEIRLVRTIAAPEKTSARRTLGQAVKAVSQSHPAQKAYGIEIWREGKPESAYYFAEHNIDDLPFIANKPKVAHEYGIDAAPFQEQVGGLMRLFPTQEAGRKSLADLTQSPFQASQAKFVVFQEDPALQQARLQQAWKAFKKVKLSPQLSVSNVLWPNQGDHAKQITLANVVNPLIPGSTKKVPLVLQRFIPDHGEYALYRLGFNDSSVDEHERVAMHFIDYAPYGNADHWRARLGHDYPELDDFELSALIHNFEHSNTEKGSTFELGHLSGQAEVTMRLPKSGLTLESLISKP